MDEIRRMQRLRNRYHRPPLAEGLRPDPGCPCEICEAARILTEAQLARAREVALGCEGAIERTEKRERAELSAALTASIRRIEAEKTDARLDLIIALRKKYKLTLRAIGKALGISHERARQLLKKAEAR